MEGWKGGGKDGWKGRKGGGKEGGKGRGEGYSLAILLVSLHIHQLALTPLPRSIALIYQPASAMADFHVACSSSFSRRCSVLFCIWIGLD